MHRRTSHGHASPASHPAEPEERRAGPPPGLVLDPPDEPPPEHPPEIPTDRLDEDGLKVIARLRHMHHKAYFVGGCVRDLLLGATPKDFDLATDAHPGEVRAIFRNCRLIGRRFRLAHVYFRGGKVIEVATFRKNPTDVAEDLPEGGDLLITRDNVFGTAEEDAVRRDFTVNGLFYDVASGEVIDYVGGRADLESRRIATIGDPEVRMREDPVRALRAVRFAARLGFTIAPDTFEAMRRHAGELARCAPARVLEEIFKILRCGGAARAFELLRACGALPVVLPALGAALDVWDEARRRSFFAHLAALDRLVRAGDDVSEAVLLGALLMHLPTGGTLGQGPSVPPGPPLAPGQPQPAGPALAHGGQGPSVPPGPPLAPGQPRPAGPALAHGGQGPSVPPGPPLAPGQPRPAGPALAHGEAAPPSPPLAPGQARPAGPAIARGEGARSPAPGRHPPAHGRRGEAHGRGREPGVGGAEAEGLLASLVQTSRLPRKIAERTRLALNEQKHLREPPRKRRRRGRGLTGQQHFTDAVQLLRITVEATGEGRDVLERWLAHADRAEGDHGTEEPLPSAEGQAETAVPAQAGAGAEGQPGGRRRRRRRGGRRRRRRGTDAAATTK